MTLLNAWTLISFLTINVPQAGFIPSGVKIPGIAVPILGGVCPQNTPNFRLRARQESYLTDLNKLIKEAGHIATSVLRALQDAMEEQPLIKRYYD